jgi:hypothetical protein
VNAFGPNGAEGQRMNSNQKWIVGSLIAVTGSLAGVLLGWALSRSRTAEVAALVATGKQHSTALNRMEGEGGPIPLMTPVVS